MYVSTTHVHDKTMKVNETKKKIKSEKRFSQSRKENKRRATYNNPYFHWWWYVLQTVNKPTVFALPITLNGISTETRIDIAMQIK